MTRKADALNAQGSLNGGEASLTRSQRREYEVLFPARDLVRNALIGAGFTDVVIEADMPKVAAQEVEVQPAATPDEKQGMLDDSFEFVPAPYLNEQEAPVAAQTIMQQTVQNPELN